MHFCRSCYLVVVPLWHPTLINNAQFVFSYRSSSPTSLKQAAETDDEKRRPATPTIRCLLSAKRSYLENTPPAPIFPQTEEQSRHASWIARQPISAGTKYVAGADKGSDL
jgi:hypothetical protein